MRRIRKPFILGAVLLVAACDMRPDHAEWQRRCIRSHDEITLMPMPLPNPNGGTSITLMPQTDTVCDADGLVCVAGKDGSTACGPQLEEAR